MAPAAFAWFSKWEGVITSGTSRMMLEAQILVLASALPIADGRRMVCCPAEGADGIRLTTGEEVSNSKETGCKEAIKKKRNE